VQQAARWKYRTQKIAILAPTHNYIFGTKAYIDNRKNHLLNSNTSSTCPDNMVNFGLLTAEILLASLGHPCKFQRLSRLGSVTALHFSSAAKLCGVEQRASPIFGRATITLGIGPHSSLVLHCRSSGLRQLQCRKSKNPITMQSSVCGN